MSWTTSDIPDLTGRTAVVTGANGGLGLETAKALAAHGATVVMAARNQDKAAAAAEQIRTLTPDASLEVVPLDLGSLDSVRAAAAQIAADHPTIDLLVNNAGVMGIPEQATADGFEMQFGTNHLGHYAFTALLLPAVLRADAPRVVTVTSTARHMGRGVKAANPHLHGSYGAWKAYGQSKLANYHFAIGLQRRFEAAGAQAASLTAHPGLSNTDLQAVSVEQTGGGFSQKFFHSMAGATGMSPAQGALPQLRAATDPRARGGELYAPRWVTNGAPVRRPILRRIGLSGSIATLWTVSERETGISLDVTDALAQARGVTPPRAATATVVADKPAAVRAALRSLVARNGFHGASMSAVASEAGVATGTAYVHYASKDELVFATYLEVKRELGEAAVAGIDPSASAQDRFTRLWLGIHRHLSADPDRARFLIQVDSSPYARAAHELAMAADGDPIMAAAAEPDLMAQLDDLPLEVLYDLGLAPAVRLAASDLELDAPTLDRLADACWRAITRPT